MSDFINAAPMVIDQGTRDLSGRAVPSSGLSVPQHLPKYYIFAEKGPIGDTYIDLGSVSLTQVYGDDTFDVNKKYYSHQSVFLQDTAAAGNNMVVHRLSPTDAKDKANIALYLDVLPVQVPLYKKNSDGSLELDVAGKPKPQLDGSNQPITVSGYKVAWIPSFVSVPVGEYQRGLLAQRAGIQVNGAKQSIQYPVFEFAASDPGEGGMKLAVKLYAAMQTDLSPFPTNIMSEGKQYPYYFAMSKIVDEITGKTNPVLNSFGAQNAKFTLKSKGVDPASGAVIDMTKVVGSQYIGLPVAQDTGLGTAYVYQNNLDTLLTMFYDSEKNITDTFRDAEINNTSTNYYNFNILSFTSSNGSPYQSTKLEDLTGSSRLTKNTNLFLKGSSDGTISDSVMDTLVKADVENYDNSLHEYNDLVLHPESVIYDTGFGKDTKIALIKFIARRKDTFVALSTFAHNAASAALSDQYSVAIALKSILELYPESSTFGTPVMRGIVVGGAGDLKNSLYTKRVPVLYEVSHKAARYMGAANGAWKSGYGFDRAPGSILTELTNIDVTWVPASTRNTLWSTGLNFVLNYEVRRQFFPALQTVYENDTSVLNSYFTVVAIAYLNKIAHAAWREFSGSISLTEAQLEEEVNKFIANRVKDKFDGKFIIIPKATVTELDSQRGYSWTTVIQIGANNMRSVMTTSVEAYRQADLMA